MHLSTTRQSCSLLRPVRIGEQTVHPVAGFGDDTECGCLAGTWHHLDVRYLAQCLEHASQSIRMHCCFWYRWNSVNRERYLSLALCDLRHTADYNNLGALRSGAGLMLTLDISSH
jgi:hypothetical protein